VRLTPFDRENPWPYVTATNLLLKILNGEELTEIYAEIPTRLIVRNSTGPLMNENALVL
jgi:DNA-binding LacI/PurR family transcriptional regulator